jgi:hypothetical protein
MRDNVCLLDPACSAWPPVDYSTGGKICRSSSRLEPKKWPHSLRGALSSTLYVPRLFGYVASLLFHFYHNVSVLYVLRDPYCAQAHPSIHFSLRYFTLRLLR